jgi:two-component system, cell cycle sensor histidine kinase and response regulator CckA
MPPASGNPFILCIDDYENILNGWKTLLEGEGYRVLTATESRSAMELFRSNPVDEVLLDYQLPEMAGVVLAGQMKEIKPAVPILMLCLSASQKSSTLARLV